MIQHLLSYLHLLTNGQNQFASGGFLLMVIGGIAASLRAIPGKIGTQIKLQTTMTLTVKDDDPSFWWIKMWFAEQAFTTKIRRLDTVTLSSKRSGESTYDIKLIPAPGVHWFWRKYRPFRMSFTRTDEPKGYNNKRTESLSFITIGRNRKVLKTFLDEVHQAYLKRNKKEAVLFKWQDTYWESVDNYKARSLESVILPHGHKEDLVSDMKRFLTAEARYEGLGLPYHRGYLLFGSPGSGKSSLASAIAGHLGMGLYALNLNEFNDRTLCKALSTVENNSVVLFEDIDAMKSARQRKENGKTNGKPANPDEPSSNNLAELLGITATGLLNSLDGLDAPHGVIFLMTTNHIEHLDAALIRPGRIDYRLEMSMATLEQKRELFTRFFPDMTGEYRDAFISDTMYAKTMADFQGELLKEELKSGIPIVSEKANGTALMAHNWIVAQQEIANLPTPDIYD